MRDIKFRAYDVKKKIIFPVHKLDFNKISQSIEFVKGYDDWDEDGYTVYGGGNMKYANKDRYILMQYTGLKDKNGKEIYEGDIVKVFVSAFEEYMNGYVKYNQDKGRFDIGWMSEVEKYKNNGFVGSCSCMTNEYDLLEVMGNIYDNPDLLEEKEQC